jgi:DNA-binding NtrC family response regulator
MKMSSAATWGRNDISTTGVESVPATLAEATVEYRLKALESIARALLQELESLSTVQVPGSSQSVRLYDEVQRFETALIRNALGKTGGSQTRAARLLGIKLTTLNSKIKRYKISRFGDESSSESDLQNHETAA